MGDRERTPVPKSVHVAVYFRDGWMCTWCGKPTVLPVAFKLLDEMISAELPGVPVALWNPQWRRDKAPLLDELGVSLDHIEAFAGGGAHDISNFTTSCARCNARKSARQADEYLAESRPWKVKGKHGEPEDWDGFASLFVILARKSTRKLTATEREWLQALEDHYASDALTNRGIEQNARR